MKICNKCKVEREDNEFDKYWHSTRQQFYIRGICNPCMREGYKQYKLKVKQDKLLLDIHNNPDYKQCSSCMEYKTLHEFYLSKTKKTVKMCKSCYVKHYKEKAQQKMDDNGGPDTYYKEPDRYTSQLQKDQVFMVMESIGWTYVDGVWFKKGIKELIDGNIVWPNIIPTIKKEKKRPLIPHGRKIKSGVWNNTEKIVKMIEEGYTYFDVAETFDCSHTTIRSVVTRYRNEKKS